MNGWERVLCWDVWRYTGRARLVVTVLGRWTFTLERTERGR